MATLLFVVFWLSVGLGILFVAVNGGVRGARARLQSQSRFSRTGSSLSFAVIIVGFGVAIPLALLTGNNSNASNQVRGVKLAPIDRQGREIFVEQCGVCHTLGAARTVGQVGPNLDLLRPKKELVLDALANGRQRGKGTMPARLVTGEDASAVAHFVEKVAGH